MRRLVSALVVLAFLNLLAGELAHAQTGSAKTPSALTDEINTLAADNTTNAFKLTHLRQITLDLVQSMLNNVQYGASPAPSQFPQLPAVPGAVWATIAGPAASGDTACINNVSGSITLFDCGAPPPVLVTSLPPVSVTGAKTLTASDCGKTQVTTGSNYYQIIVPPAASTTSGCFINIYNPDTRAKQIVPNASEFATFVIWPNDSYSLVNLGTSWATTPFHRNRLLGPRTVFVDPAGTDFPTNDCLAAGTQACRTIQGAVSLVQSTFDMGGQTATIQLADATYAENVVLYPYVANGNGNITINGDSITPIAVKIAPASGIPVLCNVADALWNVQNLTVVPTNANGVFASRGCHLVATNLQYAGNSGSNFFSANNTGTIEVGGTTTITTNLAILASANINGAITFMSGSSIVCSGITNIGVAFANAATGGVVSISAPTFSGCGSVTGLKGSVSFGGQILAASNKWDGLPGSTQGTFNGTPNYTGSSGSGTSTPNTTQYVGQGIFTSAATSLQAATNTQLYNLNVFTFSLPGAGQTYTFTLDVNGADTAVTCTVTNAANTCQDLVHSVGVGNGSSYVLKMVSSATAAATSIIWSMSGYD